MLLEKWSEYDLKTIIERAVVIGIIGITGILLVGCRAGERLGPLHSDDQEATQPSPEEQAEAKTKAQQEAQQLLEKIKQGAEFASLAKKHSACPSKEKGGDLGWQKRGELVKEFEDVAFSLEPGQMADEVVETEFGFHIIEVTDRRSDESGEPEIKVRHILIMSTQFLAQTSEEDTQQAAEHDHPPRPPEKQFPGMPGTIKPEMPDWSEAIADIHSSDELTAMSGARSLTRFLNDGTPEQKARSKKELLRATYHNQPLVVMTVCHILGSRSSEPAVIGRLQELRTHSNSEISVVATDGLTKLYASTNNISGLIDLLGIDRSDASAKAALQLTIIGREVVPKVIQVLRTSPAPKQRHAAATVLAMVCAGTNPQQEEFAASAKATRHGWMAKTEELPADLRTLLVFRDALLNDSYAPVREVCAQGLGYLGAPAAAPTLAEALNDPVDTVRRRAAAALIAIPAKAVQPALEKAVRTDSSAAVRRYAAEALGWIGDSSVVPALIDAAQDADPDVRRYAAAQLGRMGDPRAVDALVRLFDDPIEDVRWAAVVAVSKLRDPQARRALIAALDDSSTMVSNAAEHGLRKLGIAQRKATEFEK